MTARVFALLLLSLTIPCLAAADDAEWPELERTVIRADSIPMRDGVMLQVDVVTLKDGTRWPAVLTPTPYNSRQDPNETRERLLADHGYAVVHINVRGRFGSGGRFAPFLNEIPDLEDIANWTVAQSWCNGSLGLLGSSSQSYSNQLLASTGHPAIKAMVNMSGLTNTEELFFPGGAFRLDTLLPWMQFFYLQKPIRDMEEWKRRFTNLPLRDSFGWEPGLMNRMAAGMVNVEKIQVPTLHITGWNDVVYRHTLEHYGRQMARGEAAPAQRLVVGPWMHNHMDDGSTQSGDEEYGPAAAQDVRMLYARIGGWLDHHMKGIAPEPAPANAQIFVAGENAWHEHDAWPPAGSTRREFFLGGDGQLGSAPAGGPSSDFTYDPDDPVPTWGGVNSHIFGFRAGPREQSRFADRTDIVRFRTPVATADYTIAGPMEVVLFAESDAVDTDFTAKLSVVRADSTVWILEDGIVRARYRDGRSEEKWLEPGQVVELHIDLGQMARRIQAGEALQLDISSSNFPKYERNTNTRAAAFEATELKKAHQTIHHSATYPSRLVVTMHPGSND